MSEASTVVETYISMWNEADPERRRALAAQTLTEDASYLDPVMSGQGIDGVSDMIAAAQVQFPGHRFALHGGPETHHDRVRFSWALAPAGGQPIAVGTDFVTIAHDGRMRSITGFLEGAA